MFWELYQQSRIGAAQASADSASANASRAANAIHQLETRVDQLALLNMALFSLIQQHTNITEKDLEEKVREIDLADGRLDGKVRVDPRECGGCGRTLSKRHARCLYCGDATGGDPFTRASR